MIDPLSEKLISFAEAAKLFPARRQGKKPSLSCIYRWSTTGCRGVRLESLQCGSTRCTSREAVARFLYQLTEVTTGQRRPVSAPKRGERDIKAAEAELDRNGI